MRTARLAGGAVTLTTGTGQGRTGPAYTIVGAFGTEQRAPTAIGGSMRAAIGVGSSGRTTTIDPSVKPGTHQLPQPQSTRASPRTAQSRSVPAAVGTLWTISWPAVSMKQRPTGPRSKQR